MFLTVYVAIIGSFVVFTGILDVVDSCRLNDQG